jgi:hypothetical protein
MSWVPYALLVEVLVLERIVTGLLTETIAVRHCLLRELLPERSAYIAGLKPLRDGLRRSRSLVY